MPLIGEDSDSGLRVPSGTRAMLASTGAPDGSVEDMTADADPIEPPADWAARPMDADVPAATPLGGVSAGSVTAAPAGTDATEAVLVNAARL